MRFLIKGSTRLLTFRNYNSCSKNNFNCDSSRNISYFKQLKNYILPKFGRSIVNRKNISTSSALQFIVPSVPRTGGQEQFNTKLKGGKGLAPDWGKKKRDEVSRIKAQKAKFLEDYTGIKSNMVADLQEIEVVLAPLRAAVKEQGDLVRQLKENGEAEIEVKKAVLELKARKKILEDKELELTMKDDDFDRLRMEDLLKRRFFYDQSFAIYGGIAGQYDFGPMGCATKANFLNYWRQFFVLEENMLEVDCSILTPEPVLKASGHVDRFADLMVKDINTGECFRLDHLIKATLEQLAKVKTTAPETKDRITYILSTLDGFTKDEMAGIMEEFKMVSPITGNALTPPLEFNLMFGTSIGPSGTVKGFLRPETAQGIFVNFKRLLEFAQGKLPFAAAQIGNAFRNEISPRSGLIRVREFTMAEIEHFCDPTSKLHPKFDNIKDVKLTLFSACDQMDGKKPSDIAIGEAVRKGLVANETLGYFLARIQQFLCNTGVQRDKLRFRQHMGNEMAHYATDCWDAECLTSYGWVECVGCADRSAYDLNQHTKATGVKLIAERKLDAPKNVKLLQATLNKASLGKSFKKDAKSITDYFANAEQNELEQLEAKLKAESSVKITIGENSFEISNKDLSIASVEKTLHVEEFVPNVIEPSFGIGRILYSIFEHNFKIRPEDTQRSYISLPPLIAPVKCSVLPLSNKPELNLKVTEVVAELRKYEVSLKVDDSSGSIGRRYARTDEIAIPFGITIDFETVKNSTVTLRERDSTLQVRLAIDQVGTTLRDLALGHLKWEKVMEVFPKFESQDTN